MVNKLNTLVKKIKKSKGGFTLIELIVVIAILAILAVVLIPTISGQIAKANASRGQSDANSIFTACSLAATNAENDGNTLTPTASTAIAAGGDNILAEDVVTKGGTDASPTYTTIATNPLLVNDSAFNTICTLSGSPVTATWRNTNISSGKMIVNSDGSIKSVTIVEKSGTYTYPSN